MNVSVLIEWADGRDFEAEHHPADAAEFAEVMTTVVLGVLVGSITQVTIQRYEDDGTSTSSPTR